MERKVHTLTEMYRPSVYSPIYRSASVRPYVHSFGRSFNQAIEWNATKHIRLQIDTVAATNNEHTKHTKKSNESVVFNEFSEGWCCCCCCWWWRWSLSRSLPPSCISFCTIWILCCECVLLSRSLLYWVQLLQPTLSALTIVLSP